MITNVEANQQKFKEVKGIGLYKINYEMSLKGDDNKPSYIAGIIAYNSEEAVQTLVSFLRNKVKGFKGLKINELAFEGLCHEMSDTVKDAVINGAIAEGKVTAVKAKATKPAVKAKTKATKKSILPKE